MMIIANQETNLFTNIRKIEVVEFYREEIDIKVVEENGYNVAKPVYGDYLVEVNGKVYARYSSKEQFSVVKDRFIKSFYSNNVQMFIFPVFKDEKNVSHVINYAS